MNTDPDYKTYSVDELLSAYENIDKESYPERADVLLDEIHSRKEGTAEANPETPQNFEYIAPKGNWFTLHWNGLLPLGSSYWINVFAINLVVIFSTPLVFDYISISTSSAVSSGLSLIAFYIFISCLLFWQLVGLYRSANKHESRGGSAGWAFMAKIMILIGLSRFCFDMYQTGVPFILESAKLVAGKSAFPPAIIRVMNQGTEVELQGAFEFGTSDKLAEVLAEHPSIKIIHLNSIGGRIAEAQKLAEIIKQYDLITYSKTQCASACPIAFLAGKEKLISTEAKLEFHSASFAGVSGSEFTELNEGLLAQLAEAGVPSWFINKVSKVSSDDLWSPTNKELIRAGIIDTVVDSGEYANSGVNDWKNPVGLEQEMQKHELYLTLYKFDKESYEIVRGIMLESIQEGTPLNTVLTNIQNYLYIERINHYMNRGGDDEVIAYIQSQTAQMEYLQADYPAKCASYSYPDQVSSTVIDDITNLLPSELVEQEKIAFNSLIKSLSSTNYIFNDEEQTEQLTQVIEKIVGIDASYADVLINATNYKSEPAKLCTVGIMLNTEITKLPKKTAGALLRSFYTTG